MNDDHRSALIGIILTATALLAIPAAAEPRSLLDAVYTEDQAEQGEALFEQHCRTCHVPKYFESVLRSWQGQPMGVLYNTMVGSMPESNPGSLLDEEYIDIMAFILDESDFPAGDTPLDYRGGVMDDITITAP